MENDRVCSWKGPITDSKAAGALLQSESTQLQTFSASDLKPFLYSAEDFHRRSSPGVVTLAGTDIDSSAHFLHPAFVWGT